MIFRNAFNLFIDNLKLNYKYLLYKIIVVLLTVGLSAALIVPNISFIFSSAELSTLVELFKDFFGAIAKGDTEFLYRRIRRGDPTRFQIFGRHG